MCVCVFVKTLSLFTITIDRRKENIVETKIVTIMSTNLKLTKSDLTTTITAATTTTTTITCWQMLDRER